MLSVVFSQGIKAITTKDLVLTRGVSTKIFVSPLGTLWLKINDR